MTWSGTPIPRTVSSGKRSSSIRPLLERETTADEPVCILAICLYRLARGDYYYTIAEMMGLGVSTVSTIVKEVTSDRELDVERLRDETYAYNRGRVQSKEN